MRQLSRENLRWIAYVTMLIDHIGVVFFPKVLWLRMVGRAAFPIFCFLLAEGAAHTRDSRKYALRLLLAACVSELPFQLAVKGSCIFGFQNVIFTLLIGYFAIIGMQKIRNRFLRCAVAVGAYLLAEWLGTDYGGFGVLLMLLFWLTRRLDNPAPAQLLGMAVLVFGCYSPTILPKGIPLELLGVFGLVPIWLYDGEKMTRSKWLRWVNYSFYPAHLLTLYAIQQLLAKG